MRLAGTLSGARKGRKPGVGGSSPTTENKAPPGVSRVPQFPLREGRKEAERGDPDCEKPVSCKLQSCPGELVVGTCGKSASGGMPGVVALIGWLLRKGEPLAQRKELCSRLVMSAV